MTRSFLARTPPGPQASDIGVTARVDAADAKQVQQGIATQIFGVVGASDLPMIGLWPVGCRCN